MRNLKLALILITLLLTVSGCARLKWISPTNENFKNVNTVRFVDNTKPLVLATTSSKDFFPLLKIGFESIGIKVCEDCKADAIVNINITRYSGIYLSKSGVVTGGVTSFPAGEVLFYIDIVKNGKSIYKRRAGTRSRSSLEVTAADSIAPIIDVIAKARKG